MQEEHGSFKSTGVLMGPYTGTDPSELNQVFDHGRLALREAVANPFEKVAAFFLFDAIARFSFTVTNEHPAL
jgi:hypothetical protein